jgi:hypothetical protein
VIQAEIAPANLPFFVLLGEHAADQAYDGRGADLHPCSPAKACSATPRNAWLPTADPSRPGIIKWRDGLAQFRAAENR